jgi:hypothetical protein
VGPRAALEGCGKSRPTGIRSPELPVRSESLYFRAHVITTVPLSVNYAPGVNLTTHRIYDVGKIFARLLITHKVASDETAVVIHHHKHQTS